MLRPTSMNSASRFGVSKRPRSVHREQLMWMRKQAHDRRQECVYGSVNP
jgi:hypothetical protein